MSVTVETLEKNMAKLTITIAAADIEKEMQAVYTKNRSRYSLPGFRKGKVSRAQLERAYGKGLFYEDAVNNLIPAAYADAAQESGLDIASEPKLDFVEVEPGKDMIFTATVAVTPEVKLGAYKGVEVAKTEINVTEEDVLAIIKKEQEKNAVNRAVEDRAVEMGDIATIDFEGFVEGVAFEGGKGEDYPLTIGSNSFIPGFEDQIVGKNIGVEFDVNVTFPEDYQAENLAGKPAVFKCTVKKIEVKDLPELDDEFAAEVSEFDTLEEYKAHVAKAETEKKEIAAEEAKKAAVLDKIIEAAEMDIPEAMVDSEVSEGVRNFERRLQAQGLGVETYLQYFGMTMDQYREQIRPSALKNIQSRLVLSAVAAAENMEATEEEIEKKVAEMAEQYSMEAEQVKAAIDMEDLKKDILNEKAYELIVAEAVEA